MTSQGTSPIEMAPYGNFFSQYGELNVCLVSFHQSAANIRVIQDDQHGPRADDRSGKMLHLVGRQHGLVKAKAYK